MLECSRTGRNHNLVTPANFVAGALFHRPRILAITAALIGNLLLLPPSVVFGEDPQPSALNDEELKSEIQRLHAEVERQIRSDDAPEGFKEARTIAEQLDAAETKAREERQAIRRRMDTLANSPMPRSGARRSSS